jgi:putative phage-type endonuclease
MNRTTNDDDLIQRSPEWLAARSRRIGSSDIAVIMGSSPYKTRRQLWEEKTGRRPTEDISALPHIRRGNESETICRAILEGMFGFEYETPVVLHPRYPYLAASLDGICEGHLIEIKTMGDTDFRAAVERSVVPYHYQLQIQWQLLLAPRPIGVFCAFKPETREIARVVIRPNLPLQRSLQAHAHQFYRWVVRDTPPPDMFTDEELGL